VDTVNNHVGNILVIRAKCDSRQCHSRFSLYLSHSDYIELTVLIDSLVDQETTTAYCHSIEYDPKDIQERIAWLDYLRQTMTRSARETTKERRLDFLKCPRLLLNWRLLVFF